MYTTLLPVPSPPPAVAPPPSSSSTSSSSQSATTDTSSATTRTTTTSPLLRCASPSSHPAASVPRRNDYPDRNPGQPIPDESQEKPVPAIPCELLRLVAQRSTPSCAARMRQLNRLIGWLITIDDLVNVQAMFYWKSHGSAAVGKWRRHDEIPPQVTEKIYTALVALGADPLPPDSYNLNILKWSLSKGHLNVTRAIAAAGVDILGTFDSGATDLFRYRYPAFCSVVYLVEECGLQDFRRLLSEGVTYGQTKSIQFLLTSGADIRSVTQHSIHIAARHGSFEVLGLLLDMGLEGFYGATDELIDVVRRKPNEDALPTVKVLIRGGANIVATVKAALMGKWWDVLEFLFGVEEFESELGQEYALIQGVLRGDQTRIGEEIEAGEDINAFEGAALHLAIVKGKEDIVKLLLDCGANPEDSLWQVYEFIEAQKEMGVAQPSLAILSLLGDAGANLDDWMLEMSVEPAYFAMFAECLPLCNQECLNDLLITAWKYGNSKAVQTLLAAGAVAALIPDEERCHTANGENEKWRLATSAGETKLRVG
ncbi:hypothetical protein HK104_000716 [Borealophlyctis nickersoniae]|nr:hypothetical protein HK104_000716 [Borealophlyctis nickersoniae]